MDLETVNNLFLELSQFAKAKTKRELALEKLLRGAREVLDGLFVKSEKTPAMSEFIREIDDQLEIQDHVLDP